MGCLGVGLLGSVVGAKCLAQLSWWDDQEGLEGRITGKFETAPLQKEYKKAIVKQKLHKASEISTIS